MEDKIGVMTISLRGVSSDTSQQHSTTNLTWEISTYITNIPGLVDGWLGWWGFKRRNNASVQLNLLTETGTVLGKILFLTQNTW